MPAYGSLPGGIGTAVQAGDSLPMFNNDTLGVPKTSIVLARALSPYPSSALSFSINFAAAPTASVQILGSNKVPASTFTLTDWSSLYTSSNKQSDSFTDPNNFTYYCVYVPSQSAGGALTVVAQR